MQVGHNFHLSSFLVRLSYYFCVCQERKINSHYNGEGEKNQTMYFGYQAWKQGFVLHPKLGCSIYYCTSWCKGYRKPSKWVSVVLIVISNDMLCDERRRALLNKFKKVSTVNKININSMSTSQKWTKIHTALFLLLLGITEVH